jgi:hypothetical protein
MPSDKIEIKITTDSEGNPVNVYNMSPVVAETLSKILLNMAGMIRSCYNNQVNIAVREGSVAVDLIGDEGTDVITRVEEDFVKVSNNQSVNYELVQQWKSFQNLVKSNGLHYEMNSYVGDNPKKEYVQVIKESRNFKTHREAPKEEIELHFLSGEMIALGGKVPNLHIVHRVLGSGEKEYIVYCDNEIAKKVNMFLYQNIWVSFYDMSLASKEDHKGRYCDFYATEADYIYCKRIYTENKALEINKSFIYLHDEIVGLIKDSKWGMVKKVFRMFSHKDLNPSYIHALLVTTKEFREHEEIKEFWKTGYDLLKKKKLI